MGEKHQTSKSSKPPIQAKRNPSHYNFPKGKKRQMKRKFGCAKIPGYLQSSPKGLQSHPNVIPHQLRSMEVTPVAGTQIPGFREVPGAAVMATRPTSRETPLEQPSPTPALSGKAGGAALSQGRSGSRGRNCQVLWQCGRAAGASHGKGLWGGQAGAPQKRLPPPCSLCHLSPTI